MVLFSRNKWLRLIFMGYFVFAIVGAFTFVVIEPFRSSDFGTDGPISEGSLSSIDYTIDCLAEGSTIIGKVRNYSFSSLRNGQLRIATLPAHKAVAIASFSAIMAIENTEYSHIKSTILLKLRT